MGFPFLNLKMLRFGIYSVTAKSVFSSFCRIFLCKEFIWQVIISRFSMFCHYTASWCLERLNNFSSRFTATRMPWLKQLQFAVCMVDQITEFI